MPLAGEYTWKETSTHVHVRCQLRGASPKAVDVYSADVYAKLSYPPRVPARRAGGRGDGAAATRRVRRFRATRFGRFEGRSCLCERDRRSRLIAETESRRRRGGDVQSPWRRGRGGRPRPREETRLGREKRLV